MSRALGLAKAWARDRSGATAVIAALSLAVLAPAGIAMFDVYMSSQQRAKLQDALDAATLYAARSSASTTPAIDAMGDKALLANLKLIDGAVLQTSDFSLSGSKIVAVAQVQLPAFAPTVFTHDPVVVHSEVQRGLEKLEVALVLDNTGSMTSHNKLTTLKTQAAILIDKLVAAAALSADPVPLRIALVPFSNTVRVQGTTVVTGYNAVSHSGGGVPSWIDGQAKSHWAPGRYDEFDNQYTDRIVMLQQLGKSWAGCVETRPAPYDISEAPPNPADPDTNFAPYFWADEPDSVSHSTGSSFNNYIPDKTTNTSWRFREQYSAKYAGATVRSGTFDSLGMTYTYGPNAGCVLQPVIRLTTDSASIKTAISNMTAIGETDIPLGLMWGWHALTPNAPFADGSPYNTPHLKKIVILMTDGENTNYDSGDQNASHYGGIGFVWEHMSGLIESMSATARTSVLDARLSALCSAMKAQSIEIYTVRVEYSGGDPTLLRGCATSPDKFFEVADVSALGAAFDAIATDIQNLRISH